MATVETNLAERSGSLVEAHRSFDPRILLFHVAIALLLVVLVSGLAYQQLIKSGTYHERERVQNQRRVLVPGPRGNIYDRNGVLLVGNRPRFAVVLYLDELRQEFRRAFIDVRKAYRGAGDADLPELPSSRQMEQIARATVVQRYLDQINAILHRDEKVDVVDLRRHFDRQLLLPYTLLADLSAEEYARLVESLPVRSPLQVYTSSTRYYPFGSAAAHTLGYVSVNPDIDAADFPQGDLTTFKMKGTIGKTGLEAAFDEQLQGEAGGTIFRVDPAGYRVNPPIEKRLPVQGRSITCSLDIDLQIVAEAKLAEAELTGAAVAIDVNTGEVLALASKPDYSLEDTSPVITRAKFAEIEAKGGWLNRAVQGVYAPGSTFKVITAIAGLRRGTITTASEIDCTGYFAVGRGRVMPCHGGHGHGEIAFSDALSKSCNVFFYKYGIDTGVDAIAAEARRFGLAEPTGIELPFEGSRMLVGDPEWKKRERDEAWFPGDTANMSIGQGFLGVSPLQMACVTASFARGQLRTKPSLLHDPQRTQQRSEPIGLTTQQYAAMMRGFEDCTLEGTARILQLPTERIPNLRIGGKTGTAQVRTGKGTLNLAWFICFAPVERPEIAIAVMIEGDTPDEELAGGRYATPVASAILRKWKEKKDRPAPKPLMTASGA
ncbi:peptidoglycan D,D-transpeptidase FtsI family protein [Opitutus terrae]|uniref:Peptidoglycan glycosyltransferase n=1 Tax=Opitutus terrae (strain DSM 11246 / JCM 15787 / PB90-1) TaxID=452637 RepID=B1ZQX5_OPITP|nr:penicillin-binding transpeptidase domain-containing protein [Opitutus terrae]ACB77873.1 Peptidoglycan glycosyltransferase [Opitutus terrae PB90-1]